MALVKRDPTNCPDCKHVGWLGSLQHCNNLWEKKLSCRLKRTTLEHLPFVASVYGIHLCHILLWQYPCCKSSFGFMDKHVRHAKFQLTSLWCFMGPMGASNETSKIRSSRNQRRAADGTLMDSHPHLDLEDIELHCMAPGQRKENE